MTTDGEHGTILSTGVTQRPPSIRYRHAASGVHWGDFATTRERAGVTAGMIGIFQEIVTLFAIVGVGYGAKKLRFMNDEFDRMLSKLVINIALPGMILGSVLTATELPSQTEVWLCLGLSIASNLVMFAVAYGFTLLLRIPDGHRGVYRFMLCFGNVGFIGYPVLSAIFGPDALIYAAVFNLPFNLFVFTVGAWFLTLGSITTPAALLIIGSSLANLPVRELIGGPRLWACSLFRLLGMPAVIWAVFHGFVPAGLMFSVAVVLAGMPVATNGTMLCYQYGVNSRVMAQGTFVTTVLALVSIPVLATFVTAVG